MGWSGRFEGLRCVACGAETAPATDALRCPRCDGLLEVAIDPPDPPWVSVGDGPVDMWAFAELLPIEAVAGDLRAGGTPVVSMPAMADHVATGTVSIKDEARNPTGSVWDRDLAVASRRAADRGASTIALPAPGGAAQAAAAAGARAGLSVETFVPSRATHTTKAAVNVAGGEMTVVRGRYAAAREAFASAAADADWYAVEPGVNPYLRAGRRTAYWELLAANGGGLPDLVAVPVGTGGGLAALVSAAELAHRAGVADRIPRFVAVQPSGCAPIVTAFDRGETAPVPVDHPDTICGELEIPAPAAGSLALAALDRVDGHAVTVDDEAVYRAALVAAQEDGFIPSLAGGAALAALEGLDVADTDATALVVNPGSGLTDADRFRSYLMSRGQ